MIIEENSQKPELIENTSKSIELDKKLDHNAEGRYTYLLF